MVYKVDNSVGSSNGAAAMTPHPFVIKKIIKCTDDTFTLELKSAERSAGIEFAPGQFNMLYVYGVGEVPVSISGDPTSSRTLVHTVRMVGTVTRALRRLTVGETVGVRGPYGSHWPVEKAEGCDVVLVAGGIGLAPTETGAILFTGQTKEIRSDNFALWHKNTGRHSVPCGTRTVARPVRP